MTQPDKPAGNTDKKSATPSHAVGHRERLRARFRRAGDEGLQDYELLELVLFRAIPRRDVKPLAKELIAKFGDFAGVLAADAARLQEVGGVSETVATEIKIVRAAALKLARQNILKKHVISSWNELLEYCRAAMAYEASEHFRILFLDKKNRLIADEVQQRGTVDHTPVYPREVVKRALELGASAIILVHNHPSGDVTPSKADIDMTIKIRDAAKALNIALHDHLIIGREGHASFRSFGLI